MSMHMIHGVQVHGSGKKKPKKKTASILAAEKALRDTLARVGYRGPVQTGSKSLGRTPTAVVGRQVAAVKTSDVIPAQGVKKQENVYSGDDLLGVALMHKQNYEPIRKDNKQAAIESSQMRRS